MEIVEICQLSLVDDDAEAEDLFEEIGLGGHGEAFDGGIGEAGEAEAEFAGLAADFDLRDPLGVGAFEGVGDAQQGGELGTRGCGRRWSRARVARVVEPRAGMAVVAGDQRDDGDVQPVEPEDFGVQDEVFRVLVVGARADVGADLVEDGGDLEQQRVVRRELVEIREFDSKNLAQRLPTCSPWPARRRDPGARDRAHHRA